MINLNLNLIKVHCRIDHDLDDELLLNYAESAINVLESQTGRKWYDVDEVVPKDDADGMNLTTQARQALFLLVAYWYANREASERFELPSAFYRLIQPYRIYGV